MQIELLSASNFLVHLVWLGRGHGQSNGNGNGGLSEAQLDKFRHALLEVLRRRYRDHWFPDSPHKGSGYRCIRINGILDPVIAQAGETSGLSSNVIRRTFPPELTLWIDPREVSYRFGENGSICVLYDGSHQSQQGQQGQQGQQEPWKPNKNTTASTSTRIDNANSNAIPNANIIRRNLQKKNLEEQIAACKESLRQKMDVRFDPLVPERVAVS